MSQIRVFCGVFGRISVFALSCAFFANFAYGDKVQSPECKVRYHCVDSAACSDPSVIASDETQDLATLGSSYYYYDTATVCPNATRTGYHVNNWECSDGGGRAFYITGSEYLPSYNNSSYCAGATSKYVDCCLNWVGNTNTVTYNCVDGTATVPSSEMSDTATYGSSYTYKGSGICSRPGYDYSEWTCCPSRSAGVSKVCPSIGSYTKAVGSSGQWDLGDYNVVCNPVWTPVYTVDYLVGDSKNDGTGTPASGGISSIPNKHANDLVGLSQDASGMTLTGYYFDKWWCNSGIGYVDSGANWQFIMPAGNVTCTAQWLPNDYTVSYNCGTGIGTPPNSSSVTVDSSYTVANNVHSNGTKKCAKAGYLFGGWQCVADTTQTVLTITNDEFTMPADDVICTAQWDPCQAGTAGYGQSLVLANDVEIESDPDAGEPGVWKVVVGTEKIVGTSLCSTTGGTIGDVGNPDTTSGSYCWCKGSGLWVRRMGTIQAVESSWVFVGNAGANCENTCTAMCADSVINDDTVQQNIFENTILDYTCESTIALEWLSNGNSVENPSSCFVGLGNISPIAQPVRPGYTFDGWKVIGWTAQQ